MKKAKSDNGYIFWSLSIILCAVLAIFSLMFASCSSSGTDETDTPAASEPAQSTESAQPSDNGGAPASTAPAATKLAQTDDMGQEYVDKFIFLGDSTTHGLAYYKVVNENQVWTPESGTLTLSQWSVATIVYPDDGTQISIVDAVTAKKPEYMLITLGVNGVSFLTEEAFKTEYIALVQAIQTASPDTKIILNTIYPTCSDYEHKDSISLEKIQAANGWIEQLAGDLGVSFLNSYESVAGEDGYLPTELSNGDGIHLNTDGYNKVIDYLRTHGWQ